MNRVIRNFAGERECTLDNVAADIGVTRERVRQLELQAMKKLVVYSERQLGRPPADLWDIISCFAAGADPEGVQRSWACRRG